MEIGTICALLLEQFLLFKNVTHAHLRCERFLFPCAPYFSEQRMTPRLQIAALVYAKLVLHDMVASIDNPMKNAHRALLFADALLLCDRQSTPAEDHASQPELCDGDDHDAVPLLTQRLIERRDYRSSLQ